jgi:transposase InsO family protein
LDTVGVISPAAISGEKYWVTAVDEHSHFVAAVPVKSKEVISSAVKDLIVHWERATKQKVQCIRSDRGTEFVNSDLKGFCASQGIKLETSAPHTPQHNGVAERMNRTLKERTRTLLAEAGASPTLWKEALSTAVLMYKTSPVTGRPLTPTEMFSGVKPNVSGYKVWGCLVHVLVPDFQRSTFAPKTVQGMFTGYEVGSKAYRVYLGGR